MTVFANQSHLWVFILIAAAGVAATVLFYRRTPESISRRYRLLLSVLRSAALLVLAVALMEPVLALTRTSSERPTVAALLDGSGSMAIEDGTGGAARGREAFELLNEVVLPRIARDTDLVAFEFSADLRALASERGVISETPLFDGEATDIAGALSRLRRTLAGANLGAVVLATDGAANRGGSPAAAAEALGVPVFTLGVGASSPAPDIAIREAVTNRISYTGERLPIEVRVSSVGFAEQETAVRLTEGGALIESRRLRLSGTGEEETVTFTVLPSSPGVHRYTVSVPEAPGEFTTTNNDRIVATTTLKGRLRALLHGGRPSWDFAFLRRILESDANIELTVSVAAGEGGGAPPPSRVELLSYDLIVLVEPDFADPLLPADWLDDFVRDRGGGLLVVGVPDRTWTAGEEGPASVLPVVGDAAAGVAAETRVALTAEGETAPSVRIVEGRRDNADVWSKLPPVWTAARPWWRARPPAISLVSGRGAAPGEGAPLVVASREGRGNVMVVAARGIWRWAMAGPEAPKVLDRFVAGAARWLTARGDIDRVTASTDRDVYAAGEPVSVTVQVFSEDLRPLAGAEVEVDVSTARGAAPIRSMRLEQEGDRYAGTIDPLPSGSYVFEARASKDGEEISADFGEFIVERFSLEDAETRMRPAILRAVAEATGGRYVTPQTIDRLPAAVPLERRSRTLTLEFELWNSPWLLLCGAGLLAFEWALRRRRGLP